MAHAVISCLHANLAAVEAVLDDIDRQGIDTISCLGDLVGYGPQPNEVVDLIRHRQIATSADTPSLAGIATMFATSNFRVSPGVSSARVVLSR